jgi:hypothetical protein
MRLRDRLTSWLHDLHRSLVLIVVHVALLYLTFSHLARIGGALLTTPPSPCA